MRYIALLRGINVGGNNKIAMSELKRCFLDAGFSHVETYINSGNVLFDGDRNDESILQKMCETLIKNHFGFSVAVALVKAESLKNMMAKAPEWWGKDPSSKHNAIFVIQPYSALEIMEEVGQTKPEYEKVQAVDSMIFWSAPIETFSKTRWAKIVGTKAYQKITIRNANTAWKLLQLTHPFE